MDRTYDWNGNKDMPISRPELTDAQVASMIRMLTRNDLGHEPAVCIARDRIMCLVKENKGFKEAFNSVDGSLSMANNEIARLEQLNKAQNKETVRLNRLVAEAVEQFTDINNCLIEPQEKLNNIFKILTKEG